MTKCNVCKEPYSRKVNLGSAGTFSVKESETVCFSGAYDRLYFHRGDEK